MTETPQAEGPALVEEPVVEDTGAESTPAVTETDADRPKVDPIQKRFDKLTWEKHEIARERDWLRQQVQRQTPDKPAAVPETPKKAPTLADHNYDEVAYQAALVEHVKTETARSIREDLRKEDAERSAQKRRDEFGKREQTFAAKHADYLEKTRDSSLPISQAMVDLLQESDTGPDVLYHLANHPDEALKVSQMDATSAARAIGRLEAKLESPAPKPIPPKPVSQAPPPPPQIEAVEPAVTKSLSDPTLSDTEFRKIRKRQIAQRR